MNSLFCSSGTGRSAERPSDLNEITFKTANTLSTMRDERRLNIHIYSESRARENLVSSQRTLVPALCLWLYLCDNYSRRSAVCSMFFKLLGVLSCYFRTQNNRKLSFNTQTYQQHMVVLISSCCCYVVCFRSIRWVVALNNARKTFLLS